MDNGPLVSVGIPCYNRPEGLRRTLECICGQTYRNLEIIISDNCSPDPDVERVAREFACKDPRIQYFRQSVNEGPAFNFKFVLEKATGEYFMWASDDDEWESEFIQRLLGYLLCNVDASVAMSSIKRIDEYGNVFDIIKYNQLLRENYNQFRWAVFAASHDIISYFIYGLYRTLDVREFDGDFDNSFGKDMVLMCELALSTKMGCIDEILYINHIYLKKGTSERYADEEIGKSYGDPLNYFKFFLNFGPCLLFSPRIPIKNKLCIPFMVIKQGMWIGRIYLRQISHGLFTIAVKSFYFVLRKFS